METIIRILFVRKKNINIRTTVTVRECRTWYRDIPSLKNIIFVIFYCVWTQSLKIEWCALVSVCPDSVDSRACVWVPVCLEVRTYNMVFTMYDHGVNGYSQTRVRLLYIYRLLLIYLLQRTLMMYEYQNTVLLRVCINNIVMVCLKCRLTRIYSLLIIKLKTSVKLIYCKEIHSNTKLGVWEM